MYYRFEITIESLKTQFKYRMPIDPHLESLRKKLWFLIHFLNWKISWKRMKILCRQVGEC